MLAVRSCLRFGATTCVARPSVPVSTSRRGFRGREFLDEIHQWRDKVIKLANPSIGVTKGDIDPWKASVSEQDEPDRGENRPEPVVEALKAGSLGFGFSAGGMLFPYYIGVVEALEELGIITEDTKIGGASAGSLIAATYHSGIGSKAATEACLTLAAELRKNGTRGRLKSNLRTFLEKMLPDDVHERCTNKAYISVTRAFPRPRNMLLSEYTSREDLIEALLTSCHIPWWFDNTLFTTFRGKLCYDGGLTNFIPLPPTQHGVRVCCFPSKQITTIYDIGISPDNYEDWPHTLQEMLSWAFEPAEDKLLLEFIGKGRADAKAWAKASGALAVVQPDVEQEVPAKADQQSEDYQDLENARPGSDSVKNAAQAAAVQGKATSTKAGSPSS